MGHMANLPVLCNFGAVLNVSHRECLEKTTKENSGMGSTFRLWKTVLQLLVGVVVSTLLLTVLVESIRKSSGEFQLEDLAAVVSGVPLWAFGFALVCHLIQGSLRSIRFSLLLKWDALELT